MIPRQVIERRVLFAEEEEAGDAEDDVAEQKAASQAKVRGSC